MATAAGSADRFSGGDDKPKLTEHQRREAIRRRDELGEPVRDIARSNNVSHSTISRLAL
jgi:IS30 family transposase